MKPILWEEAQKCFSFAQKTEGQNERDRKRTTENGWNKTVHTWEWGESLARSCTISAPLSGRQGQL